MTSLKSIMERRTMQVLDVRDMKSLKGGLGVITTVIDTATAAAGAIIGTGLPPPPPDGQG